MAHTGTVRYLFVLFLTGFSVEFLEGGVLEREAGLPSRWTGAGEKLLAELSKSLAVEEEEEDVCLDGNMEKMTDMFRYLDNNRNQLKNVLEQNSCWNNKDAGAADDDTWDQEFSQRLTELKLEIEQMLLAEDEKSQTLENVFDHLHRKILGDRVPVARIDIGDIIRIWQNITADSPADSPAREECYIDYSGFVEPITNSIFNGIIESVCELLSLPPLLNFLCVQNRRLPNVTMPSWGLRMIDAMAKIPSTILDGKLSWVGAYDLCHNTKVTYNHTAGDERSFTGKYCRLDMTTRPKVNSTAPPVTLQFGVCVPDTCDSYDVDWYISENNTVLSVVLLLLLEMEITYVYCGMEDLDSSTDTALQAALGITFFCLLMVVIATIYDGFFRKNLMKKRVKELDQYVSSSVEGTKADRQDLLDDKPLKIKLLDRCEMLLVGFSGYTNCRKVFTIRDKPGDIPVLNGIRFLSYVYVMWGNTYVFGPIYSETWVTANIVGALPRLTKDFLFQPIINFHLAEDSFLLISGILVTYWFLRRYEADGRLSLKSIIYYFLHRYWRLMPVMMLCIMILTCTYKYTADGPLFPPKDTDAENCKVNWWVDMLMVHNIVKVGEQCFGHAWFVPLVFQLHVAAIVVVIPLVLWPVVGYVMTGVMYAAHIGATAAISYDLRKNRMDDWYNEYLLTPWCRAGPFVIGLAFGIVMHKRRQAGIALHWALSLCLWLVALVCVLMPAFASYSEYKEGGERWGDDALIAYDTLARSSWALGVGWIALACHFRHGGVIDSFLSWKAWTPLSRLVYTTMLMHGLFIFTWVYTSRLPIYIDNYHMMYALFGHLIFIMIIGLIISLIWDLPFGTGVEKALLAKTKFHWIRAGRHPRRYLEDVEKRFWNLDTDGPQRDLQEANGRPAIPNCNYVEVNKDDAKKLGFDIEGKDHENHEDNRSDKVIAAYDNLDNRDRVTVAYDNLVFEKEPDPDYDMAYGSVKL